MGPSHRPESRSHDTPPPRGVAALPPEFDDVLAWAAWLYYVDQLTQSEVAARLGVSRASVVSYLQEARERGIVSIRVDPGAMARTALSRRLAQRFGLAGAAVIPSVGEAGEPATARLGKAGARVLAGLLAPEDVIGVAWGRTVLAVAQAAVPAGLPGLTVVQVSGSSIGTADFSPELCTSLLATQLGARCVNLHAPAVLSSPELRDRLLAEPSLRKQFELIRSTSKILFGVGDIGPESTLASSGMVEPGELRAARRQGAVGVVIGRLIDAAGAAVARPLDARIVGIGLEDLRHVPVRLCVAGGLHKRAALSAALAGGYATHLVTDSGTAEALLD